MRGDKFETFLLERLNLFTCESKNATRKGAFFDETGELETAILLFATQLFLVQRLFICG